MRKVNESFGHSPLSDRTTIYNTCYIRIRVFLSFGLLSFLASWLLCFLSLLVFLASWLLSDFPGLSGCEFVHSQGLTGCEFIDFPGLSGCEFIHFQGLSGCVFPGLIYMIYIWYIYDIYEMCMIYMIYNDIYDIYDLTCVVLRSKPRPILPRHRLYCIFGQLVSA